MKIAKYTFGSGDRFGHQGEAQLQAILDANKVGIPVFPTWNKSHREHTIVGTVPDSLRKEADAAVASLGWEKSYYVDADHVGLKTVDAFLAGSNFFTLDVADYVGQEAHASEVARFKQFCSKYLGELAIPGLDKPFSLNDDVFMAGANTFLRAIEEAGAIYRHIAEKKGRDAFVTEVSIDETHQAQTPVELFLILAMLAFYEIPAQTIAPKFSGRFNKGVDYVGDLAVFEKEFREDLFVIDYCCQEFGLPQSLKLSVHSGSDKFSLYPIVKKCIQEHGCGLHVKTAGTTWLEEVIGLAESGGEALQIAKEIYSSAWEHYDELTAPYATVIDIDKSRLPSPDEVADWSSDVYVKTLRHEQTEPLYNPDFRQLIHVGFKVAAKMGERYLNALVENKETIAANVKHNLLERHIRKIFPAE